MLSREKELSHGNLLGRTQSEQQKYSADQTDTYTFETLHLQISASSKLPSPASSKGTPQRRFVVSRCSGTTAAALSFQTLPPHRPNVGQRSAVVVVLGRNAVVWLSSRLCRVFPFSACGGSDEDEVQIKLLEFCPDEEWLDPARGFWKKVPGTEILRIAFYSY